MNCSSYVTWLKVLIACHVEAAAVNKLLASSQSLSQIAQEVGSPVRGCAPRRSYAKSLLRSCIARRGKLSAIGRAYPPQGASDCNTDCKARAPLLKN